MQRLNQRQGFLVSAIVHLVILMSLASVEAPKLLHKPQPLPPEERTERVYLLRPEELRRLVPMPPAAVVPRPMPRATPEPRSQQTKDRMSIGGPSAERLKGPLELRRDQEIMAPKGKPNAQPTPPPPTEQALGRRGGDPPPEGRIGDGGLRLPPGIGTMPRGDEGSPRKPGPTGDTGPSIAGSLRSLEKRLQEAGPAGIPSGTGQQMGPLFFDPEGADFTLWINHFRNEVYRNWIVPQPALMGFRGHVDLAFTVERDGRLTNLKMLKSSGTLALDRAAENALLGSRLLPLPSDFGPPRVTMQVTFFYNEGPQGS